MAPELNSGRMGNDFKSLLVTRSMNKLKLVVLLLFSVILYLWVYRIIPRKNKGRRQARVEAVLTKTNKINLFSAQNKEKRYKKHLQSQCGSGWRERYVKFHRQAITEPSKQNKYLVYFCGGKNYGCGGYGNRLNAISSLLLLAVLTDRVFLIDWNYSIPLQDYFLPGEIHWNVTVKHGRRNFWGAGYPSKVTQSVRRPFVEHKDLKQFIINTDFELHFNQPVEVVTAMWYFAEYLRYNKYLKQKIDEMDMGNWRFSWVGCAFQFLFTKTQRLHERLRQARESLGMGSGIPFLGVHIRMGDRSFGKITKRSGIRTKDYTKIIKCAFALRNAKLKSHPEVNTIRIFLATDDVNLKRVLIEQYKDFRVLNVTVEHTAIFREKRKIPSKEGMMGMLLDHFLLAECDFLVLSRSSFGETAAGIRLHPGKTYVFGERCEIT